MLAHLILLVLLFGLMQAAVSFSPAEALGAGAGATTLASGFLLLTANLAGNVFKSIGLPKLTGYLFTGVLVGPGILDLVSERMLVDLRIFNGVAIALIALTAGSELHIRGVRPLLRTITWISGIAIVGTMIVLAGSVYLLGGLLPFSRQLDQLQWAAVALVLGVAMTAQSPAVVVALRKEMQAQGPMASTVLGVVVISDIVVIVGFAITSSLAVALTGGQVSPLQAATGLAWEIFGSIFSGLLTGVLIAAFMKRAHAGGGVFLIITGLVIAEVGQRIHFDPLLVALSAGILVRNATSQGERLHDAIESSSLPVYVGFFAVSGATIHLDALRLVGIPALIIVGIRAASFLAGSNIACRLAAAPAVVRKFSGFGLLPQAGLAIGLALLFARLFPDLCEHAAALILSVVAFNELIAPVAYRWALLRSGEAGKELVHVEEDAWAAGALAEQPPAA